MFRKENFKKSENNESFPGSKWYNYKYTIIRIIIACKMMRINRNLIFDKIINVEKTRHVPLLEWIIHTTQNVLNECPNY